ncbi:hypothetical protein M405DRAFT_464250 [Rhizopogon salebrosus TDB-379]|nr:hypothetical protein M405DRAFT_464250 [Rhizopogon salebrosus TDB-379]
MVISELIVCGAPAHKGGSTSGNPGSGASFSSLRIYLNHRGIRGRARKLKRHAILCTGSI